MEFRRDKEHDRYERDRDRDYEWDRDRDYERERPSPRPSPRRSRGRYSETSFRTANSASRTYSCSVPLPILTDPIEGPSHNDFPAANAEARAANPQVDRGGNAGEFRLRFRGLT
jgi:hypothetical protein